MVFRMRNRGPVLRWGTSVAASALFATLLVAVGIAVRVEAPVSRSAGVTDLCSGWSGCRSAGYSDAGYGAVSGRMYWNMYSGHNCTNYVAYRMIKAGMSTTRPWVGGGNASEWGLHMKSITDQVPNVGAVAWWARYDNGSGSAGHVGYVEKVVSANEIIISMDSWGGTFHWRRITKDSGRWPTGFIHFVDKKLRQTAAGAITGTGRVAEKLTVTPGTWTPSPTLRYQWFVGGTAVAGATGTSYTPTAADLGKPVTARITATRSGYGSVSATVAGPTAVSPGVFTPGAKPVITGEAYVGGVLSATSGTWSPTTSDIVWRWRADGVWVRGFSRSTMRVPAELRGKAITVTAVARKAGYADGKSPSAAATAPVLAGKVTASEPVAITGAPQVGATLSAVPGTYAPADATASYQWLRNGVAIPGATRSSYVQTAADAGKVVGVRTVLTRPQYAPLTLDATAAMTRTTSTVKTWAYGQRRRVVVFVRVTAPGVVPVNGVVDVTVGPFRKAVTLVDGRGRLVFEGFGTAGEKRVRAAFRETPVVVASRWAGTVVVQ